MGYTGEQKREYQRAWLKSRRDRGIDLLGGMCVNCESQDRLEFDHVNPDTKSARLKAAPTASFWSWSWAWIVTELEKCQLLCYTCHKEKTSASLDKDTCRNGHDKNVVGRDLPNRCAECRREKDRRARREGRKK